MISGYSFGVGEWAYKSDGLRAQAAKARRAEARARSVVGTFYLIIAEMGSNSMWTSDMGDGLFLI